MYGYSQGGDDTTMIIMVMIIFCCSIFCVGIYYYIENEDDDDVVDPCNDLTTQTLCSTLPTCTWDTTTLLCRTTPVSPVTCTLEQHVSSKVCVPCPKFGTNLGFRLKSATAAPASGADTSCTVKQPCPENWHVNNGSCEACPAGKINDAGDDPNGSNNTECQRPACTSTQYMVCPPTPLPPAAQCTFTAGDENSCTSKPGCSYTAPVAASGSDEAVPEACVPDDQCNCVNCPTDKSVCTDRISPDDNTASTEESSVCQDVCVTGNTPPVLSLCPSGHGVPGQGYRVGENGECIPCEEGKTTFEPQDRNIRNTSCKLPLCEVNEYVRVHAGGVALCTPCPTGQANDNQDDPNLMAPTECNQCAEDHYVEQTGSTRSCVSCGVDDDHGEPLVNPIRLDKNSSPPGKEGVCKRRPCYNPGEEGGPEGGEQIKCSSTGTGISCRCDACPAGQETALTHTLSPDDIQSTTSVPVDSGCITTGHGASQQILLDRIQTLIDSAQVDDFSQEDFEAMKVEIDEKIESMGDQTLSDESCTTPACTFTAGDSSTCGTGCTYTAPVAEVTEACAVSVDCTTFTAGDPSTCDTAGGCTYTAASDSSDFITQLEEKLLSLKTKLSSLPCERGYKLVRVGDADYDSATEWNLGDGVSHPQCVKCGDNQIGVYPPGQPVGADGTTPIPFDTTKEHEVLRRDATVSTECKLLPCPQNQPLEQVSGSPEDFQCGNQCNGDNIGAPSIDKFGQNTSNLHRISPTDAVADDVTQCRDRDAPTCDSIESSALDLQCGDGYRRIPNPETSLCTQTPCQVSPPESAPEDKNIAEDERVPDHQQCCVANQTCGEASAEAAYTGNIIVGADGFIIDGAATTDLDTFIGKIIEIIKSDGTIIASGIISEEVRDENKITDIDEWSEGAWELQTPMPPAPAPPSGRGRPWSRWSPMPEDPTDLFVHLEKKMCFSDDQCYETTTERAGTQGACDAQPRDCLVWRSRRPYACACRNALSSKDWGTNLTYKIFGNICPEGYTINTAAVNNLCSGATCNIGTVTSKGADFSTCCERAEESYIISPDDTCNWMGKDGATVNGLEYVVGDAGIPGKTVDEDGLDKCKIAVEAIAARRAGTNSFVPPIPAFTRIYDTTTNKPVLTNADPAHAAQAPPGCWWWDASAESNDVHNNKVFFNPRENDGTPGSTSRPYRKSICKGLIADIEAAEATMPPIDAGCGYGACSSCTPACDADGGGGQKRCSNSKTYRTLSPAAYGGTACSGTGRTSPDCPDSTRFCSSTNYDIAR